MAVRSYDKIFIGGALVPSSATGVIDIISPATEEVIATVPDATPADIDRAVAAARLAFDRGPWPRMQASERASILAKVSDRLTERADEIAELITEEMGAALGITKAAQISSPLAILDYYVGLADHFAFEEIRPGLTVDEVLVTKEPVGVVGAIAPWNVPLFMSISKLAPALLAGCTVVYKPAPETPLDAYLLAEIFTECGLPEGVMSVVPAGRVAGEHLVSHPDVDKISFTGSTAAGRRIAELCGAQLKRCTLELGGKSAAIILDDADIAAMVPRIVPLALLNAGQICVAQTRILAPRSRYDEVVEALCQNIADSWTVGDPMDPATRIGPLVAERQRDRVESYVARGIAEGARLALGGQRPAGLARGWYVEPTVFADVDNQMAIAREEIFGPVISVIPYEGDDEAVALANDSDYGLCGSVFTADNERGLGIARRVRTGTYMVNSWRSFDIGAPFGGYKQSGLGRELGPEGLEGFLEIKSIALPKGYRPEL
jgi:betaine-aldehyde dehydrogenase